MIEAIIKSTGVLSFATLLALIASEYISRTNSRVKAVLAVLTVILLSALYSYAVL